MTQISGSSGFGAAEDLELSVTLLNHAVAGDVPPRLFRSYLPARTVAFTMRERRLPGYAGAWQAAEAAKFTPVLRRTGGRVAAYDASCLIVDVIEPADLKQNHSESFARIATALTGCFRTLGVDARIGEVAGEYCPGEFSVGARGAVKLVGISQRVSRGFRLISSVIAIEPAPHIVDVLVQVHEELAFDWNPQTCGSVSGELAEAGAVGFTSASIQSAIRDSLVPAGSDTVTLAVLLAEVERRLP